jgi:small subunit ribosomal protein S6
MRRYETVFIANPSLSQEERQPFLDKLTQLISDGQGLLIKFDEWGLKSLAYEVQRHTRGYYGLLDFCGDGPLVKELERNLGLDDRCLKYMTVCTAKEVDDVAIRAEIKAAEAAKRSEVAEEEGQAGSEGEPESEASPPTSDETQEESSSPSTGEEDHSDG